MWKRIKRAIRIARRNSKARRQRKRTSEILLAIFTLTNCGTLQELEYHAGYYAGTADQAAAVGEITREQRGQILRVLHYISAGERERLASSLPCATNTSKPFPRSPGRWTPSGPTGPPPCKSWRTSWATPWIPSCPTWIPWKPRSRAAMRTSLPRCPD